MSDSSSHGGQASAWPAALSAGSLSVLVGALLARPLRLGPVDDAFISLRYAHHWAQGQGLVFNPGERVEGYTNFAWVALEATAIRLGVSPEAAMWGLGWFSLFAVAASVATFLVREGRLGQGAVAVLTASLVALNPMILAWSTSGLETGFYASLIVMATLAAWSAQDRWGGAKAAGWLVAAFLTRPEALVLAPVLWFTILRRRERQVGMAFIAVFVAGASLYFSARGFYFDRWLPNTFYAKLDYGGFDLARRGAGYALGFLCVVPSLTLATLWGAWRWKRAPGWFVPVLAVAVTQLVVIVWEGGDHFPLYRFAVPVLPLLALSSVAAVSESRRHSLLALGLVAIALPTVGFARPWAGGEGEVARFSREVLLAQHWGDLGRHLALNAPGDATLATIAIGSLGFHSNLRLLDPHGIVDPVIAGLDQPLGRGYAGHEKFDVDDLLSRRPHYLLIFNLASPVRLPEAALPRLVWGRFNQALMAHPELAEQYRLEDLAVGDNWWSLHVRRDLLTPR
ncbi:hypothetical protein MK489_11135 [Myxococcota bacterium]|nr:hypothetical protein [Myxococcota bacterium]